MEYYVYELIDPRDLAVFYVGKGRKDRMSHHEMEAKRGVYSRKCKRIRDIWAAGFQVKRAKVARFSDEMEAYAFEARHIASIGLNRLTNVLPGGLVAPRATKPKEAFKFQLKHLLRLAPSIQRALRIMERGNGRLYVCDGIDITAHVWSILIGFIADLGSDIVFEKLKIQSISYAL